MIFTIDIQMCLGSNYHCSLCRKVVNWMALRDECAGYAWRTKSCREKAEKARACPDLTENFDNCWTRIKQCTDKEPRILLKSSKSTHNTAATKIKQHVFKSCILDQETNTQCFQGDDSSTV